MHAHAVSYMMLYRNARTGVVEVHLHTHVLSHMILYRNARTGVVEDELPPGLYTGAVTRRLGETLF